MMSPTPTINGGIAYRAFCENEDLHILQQAQKDSRAPSREYLAGLCILGFIACTFWPLVIIFRILKCTSLVFVTPLQASSRVLFRYRVICLLWEPILLLYGVFDAVMRTVIVALGVLSPSLALKLCIILQKCAIYCREKQLKLWRAYAPAQLFDSVESKLKKVNINISALFLGKYTARVYLGERRMLEAGRQLPEPALRAIEEETRPEVELFLKEIPQSIYPHFVAVIKTFPATRLYRCVPNRQLELQIIQEIAQLRIPILRLLMYRLTKDIPALKTERSQKIKQQLELLCPKKVLVKETPKLGYVRVIDF